MEPLYLIYLHFFAASSQEMCARPLHGSSPSRAKMLQQAREHYETAIALIQKAEDSVSENSSRPSSFSSSQLHSPAGSVSWTSSSAVSSPTASVCSFDDILLEAGETEPTTAKAAAAPQPRTAVTTRPRKKTVTFSEPLIRPDSPTLGFDESLSQNKDLPPLPRDDADLGDAAAKDVSLDDSAQRTPKAFRPPPPMFDEMPLPPLPKAVLIAKAAAASVARRSGRDNGSSSNRDSTSTVDSATSAQGSTSTTTSSSSSSSSSSSRPSTLKYLAGLASLREQLRFHLSAVEALISQPTTSANAATATTTATLLPTPVIVPGKLPGGNINRPASVAARRTSSRLSGATSWYSGATAATDGSVDASAISEAADAVRSADEARAQELRARIARLRSEGWRRKRFDASRYEALCDRVMGEIA